MMNLFALLRGAIWRVLRARRELLLENLALRQQLAALTRRHPRPRLTIFDKAFWILAHVFWSAGWKQVLIVVTPETVLRWHRAGFRWLCLAKTLADFEINNIAGGPLAEFCYNSDYAQRALARVRVAPSTVPPENLEISESMRVIRPS